MNRKWCKIDENRLSRNIKFDKIKNIIIDMYNNGYSATYIIKNYNLKKGVVYKHIRNYKKSISA